MKNKFKKIVLTMILLIVILISLLFVYNYFKGNIIRAFFKPSILNSNYIVDLNAENSLELRSKFIKHWDHKGPDIGIKHIVYTVEGDPLEKYLLLHDKRLILIIDYTRDSYSNGGYSITELENVELHKIKYDDIHPLMASFPETGEILIRCFLKNGNVAYF